VTVPSPGMPIEILLVDDDAGDVLLTREGLADGPLKNNLHVVSDGVQAMAFLRHQPPYEQVPKPDLMVLDLNLPKKDGREVLAEVKADRGLRRIPVVILTSSGADEDIERSYDDHANAYVQKGIDLDRFLRVVHGIDDFFGSVVRLPSR
jgi:CheY-like chemotaxis protein